MPETNVKVKILCDAVDKFAKVGLSYNSEPWLALKAHVQDLMTVILGKLERRETGLATIEATAELAYFNAWMNMRSL